MAFIMWLVYQLSQYLFLNKLLILKISFWLWFKRVNLQLIEGIVFPLTEILDLYLHLASCLVSGPLMDSKNKTRM